MKLITRAATVRLAVLLAVLFLLGTWAWFDMLRMPGSSFRGELTPLTPLEQERAERLAADVAHLAQAPRTLASSERMEAIADWIADELAAAGLAVERQRYALGNAEAVNVIGIHMGASAEAVVVGAHYDSIAGCPGANDNASGVAAMIALARSLDAVRFQRSLRFVAFANEEPPYFQREGMGSLAYARRCRERGDDIAAMISLETIGYYADEPGSQRYPSALSLFYPSTGDFIAFVGHRASRQLVRRAITTFRDNCRFPSEGAAPPSFLPGVSWSDHWAFWQHGYPDAIMVTDTAPFRYADYHRPSDTPDKLSYDRMARVVSGLEIVVRDLAGPVRLVDLDPDSNLLDGRARD